MCFISWGEHFYTLFISVHILCCQPSFHRPRDHLSIRGREDFASMLVLETWQSLGDRFPCCSQSEYRYSTYISCEIIHQVNLFIGRSAWDNRLVTGVDGSNLRFTVEQVMNTIVHFLVEASWNVMVHAQKTDFVFRRNGRVHLNQRGRQFSRLLAAEVCTSAVVMLDTPWSEVVWRVLATPLHSPVSLSYPLPCVTVCHHISAGVYQRTASVPFHVRCNSVKLHYVVLCLVLNTNWILFVWFNILCIW